MIRFIKITKLSDPDMLDTMNLPIYEEVIMPLQDLIMDKRYFQQRTQNGERDIHFPASMMPWSKEEKNFLDHLNKKYPPKRIISSGYKYFVLNSRTGVEFEISDYEFERISSIILQEQEG